MTIAIIADDLTGANDSGLQFASYGLPTTVFLGHPSDELLDGAEVAVLDTETRGRAAAEVPALINAVARRLREKGTRHVYKKIDSTMRGHVGLELDVAAQALNADIILLTPAFPAMRRTVEQGCLLVDGTPVDRTAIARDPGSPVRDADLIRLLSPHMRHARCLTVTIADLATPSAVEARLCEIADGGGRPCAVFDAVTDADLSAIAAFGTRLAARHGKTILWAGSAGLATHLPAAWNIAMPERRNGCLPAARRSPLLVVGSVNPVSTQQLDLLAKRLEVEPVVLSPDRLLNAGADHDAEIARGLADMRGRLDAGDRALVLTTAHTEADVDRIVALARKRGLSWGEAGRRIAEGLAAVAIRLLDESAINRLVTTGGDTSRAIMDAADIRALTVEGAVEPGIPLMTTRNGPRRHIVTKAGGFGSAEALLNAMTCLMEGRPTS